MQVDYFGCLDWNSEQLTEYAISKINKRKQFFARSREDETIFFILENLGYAFQNEFQTIKAEKSIKFNFFSGSLFLKTLDYALQESSNLIQLNQKLLASMIKL